ncbi:MAG TPA: hypothetical protein DCG49_08255 [Ruminococcus sp.]|nr:hypothetical protein [Ruminococcus sp.]
MQQKQQPALQQGDTLHGFTVTRVRHSDELDGNLIEMVYDKTGTELVWMENQIENKLFSIAFKTLPEDSTGVFHILEHSVLCGSAKYPVREPFVELLKSSMNTFLNAMTFPDKTMYPVSSRNTRDFLNLTEVYLDAVFAPAILKNPNIFYQEGWHIEEAEDGTLSYKGVVFNEMKGALGSADELAEYKLLEMLYRDTAYGFNSGGDPAVIPSLRYEKFCETYHRFYHPSNARIYLDGSIPLDDTLRLIDEYLCRYERSEALPVLQMQKPVSDTQTQYYELAKDESAENKGILTVGKIIGTWKDRTKLLAVRVLNDAVAGSNEAPLKRAILSAGLAQEMSISADDSVAQPYLMLHFRNVADGKADEILPLIRKAASEMLEKGVDKEALRASANILEFRLLEPEEPQGLERCINCMNSWLHGGDPMLYLEYLEAFAEIRRMIEDGAFDALLRELYLDETGLAVLHTLPSYTRGEELRQEEADRLAAIKASWTEADLAANRTLNEKLLNWQQTPDTQEQLATLPTLPLSAVNEVPAWTETVEKEICGIPVLYHPAACSGIVHFTLNFALTDFTLEELPQLMHAATLMGQLSTANYSALELQQKLKNTVGRMNFSIEALSKKDQNETCTPVFSVRCSVLREKLSEAFDLVTEVLRTTDLTQKEKIREFMQQADERARQLGVMAGHSLGLSCVMAGYSAQNAVRSALNGFPAIRQIHALMKDYDGQFAAFSGLLQKMQKDSFCISRMVYASVTAAEDADLAPLIERFPQGTAVPKAAAYKTDLPFRTGYPIPAQIGYAVQGCRLGSLGLSYHAGLRAAAKIISLSYLWNTVRVQGGAYGTGLSVQWDGSVFTYSYRDPSPAHSLEVNRGISAFIRSFCESGEPLDKFIISTLSDGDPLRSPREEGMAADCYWTIGRTKEDLIADRRQILALTREDLLSFGTIWDTFAAQGAVCICASENLLADCPDLTDPGASA